jgi:DnaK suppressor protein
LDGVTSVWTRSISRDRARAGRRAAKIVLLHAWMTNRSKTTSHLSSTDLARLRRKLEQKRDALLASEHDATDSARGVSDYAIEDADVAERMIEQESALRQGAVDSALLEDIERALRKLEAGTYGFSEDSGAPIELERLEAIPWARRTADEEQRHAARSPSHAK